MTRRPPPNELAESTLDRSFYFGDDRYVAVAGVGPNGAADPDTTVDGPALNPATGDHDDQPIDERHDRPEEVAP